MPPLHVSRLNVHAAHAWVTLTTQIYKESSLHLLEMASMDCLAAAADGQS